MDLQAVIVFVGGFGFCAVVGYIVSVFGAKEQTYEEALEAQKAKKEAKKPSKGKNSEVNNKKKKWKKSNKGDGADKHDAVPIVLVASSSKAKKRRKGPFSDVELIVDPTSDECSLEPDQHRSLYSLPTPTQEEEDVVLVEPTPVESLPPVEPTPEPSPQPTPEPKKPKSKKKNKIPIEDVEELVEEVVAEPPAPEVVEAPVVEEEEVVEKAEVVELPTPPPAPEPVAKSTPTKGKGKKQKAEPAAPQSVLPGTPRDLLAAVKKTSFNDEDAQAMINVLLTKQSGDALNTSEEWIEQGKPSETKQLKQELAEAFKALEEERNHKIAFEKQLTTMKKDLNEKLAGVKKAAGAEHQRIMGELAAQHTHQMNQTNARLAEMHNNEMGMRSRLDEVQMEKIHTVTQFQAQVDNLAHQLQMAQNVPTPTFNDPSLLTELEQLRSLRDRYEGQLNEFLLENKNLKEQLTTLKEVECQLTGAKEEVRGLEGLKEELESQLASAKANAGNLEAEVSRVNIQLSESKTASSTAADLVLVQKKLAQVEAENVKLAEENERLSEQVASSVERPAADGEEAEKANGHAEVEAPASKEEELAGLLEEWREKCDRIHLESEKMLANQKVIMAELEEKLAESEGNLDAARTKSNELETKLESVPSDLLARLFPDIQDCTEEKAALHISGLKSYGQTDDEVEKLEGQVEHYKAVLAQTESMLTSLQASVESAEADWKVKLEASTKELTEARGQASLLAEKAVALEQEVAQSAQTGEMQRQLAALQQQLLAQEAEKKEVEKRNEELSGRAATLSEEVRKLTEQQEELAKGNTGLQAALGVAQEALEREKGGIKALQEQLQCGKAEVIGNGTGPSDEDLAPASLAFSASNPSIASSLDGPNQPSEKKKKSKTKKLFGLLKSSK